MNYAEESLRLHGEWHGKIEVVSRVPVQNKDDLSLAYTPGVAQPCLAIHEDYDKSFTLTRRHNLVAVITDGTAVLGLGDIGPEAGMPVMEGKCALFKAFGGVDAFPICNQHGTAVVVAAALINALKVVKKNIDEVKVVINGAGSAGIAIAKHLMNLGVRHIKMVDSAGILYEGRQRMNPAKDEMARIINPEKFSGSLADAMKGADVFIGVSAPHIVTQDMVRSMAPSAILFPMSNPVPEIEPDEALAAGAAVVGTGRSDHPNQINNVMCFPGLFRGALDVRASDINEEMKQAASRALAGLVSDEELDPGYILPMAFDKRIGPTVSEAVAKAARESGVARI